MAIITFKVGLCALIFCSSKEVVVTENVKLARLKVSSENYFYRILSDSYCTSCRISSGDRHQWWYAVFKEKLLRIVWAVPIDAITYLLPIFKNVFGIMESWITYWHNFHLLFHMCYFCFIYTCTKCNKTYVTDNAISN